MKRVWNYIVTMWQPVSMLLIGLIIIGGLMSYKIGSLVPGANTSEIASRASSSSLKVILKNPINAPYKTALYIGHSIHNSISSDRIVSGLVAASAILLFYLIIRHFCKRPAAILSTVLFATSTSLLSVGRLASPNVLPLLLISLIACGYYLRFGTHPARSWLITSVTLAICLYVPGLIYFIIGGILWQLKAVKHDNKWPKPIIIGICAAITFLLLLPLLLGFIQNPHIWREYFGIPAKLPTIIDFLKSFAATIFGIFVWAPKNPIFRLGRQPVLDIFSGVMFILGCYSLVKRFKLDRLVLMLGLFILAALYTALSGNYENSIILLPFIYFCIAFGIGMLLEEWRKIFPNNPLASGLALVVITIAVIISANFQSRRYFVAWPHNSQTKSAFSLKKN
jgi:4-amino-4-deoxy-L-arabinose transferase-like glycosyltransferase